MKYIRYIVTVLLILSLVLPAAAVETEQEQFVWDMPKEALLAGLWEADITAVRQALDLRLITCVELTEYYLERIETYNQTYNCFITMCEDALERAAACDEAIAAGTAEGKLFGVPMVIKDNMDYAGYYTTNGQAKQDSKIADTTAPVVQAILDEGAIIIGKTNMSTGAQDSKTSTSVAAGETKNAYGSWLASGGSSGGSAVATSLNFAAAGLGTDTNSSLRLPAVLNGCVALRATWNTMSVQGIKRLNSKRDVPGAITRTVKDQAILLDVLSGGTTNYTENLNADVLSGLRIGVLKELSYATGGTRSEANIDDEVAAAFEKAVENLKACGAEVVEVSMPDVFRLADYTYYIDEIPALEEMYAAVEKTMTQENVSALIFPTYLNTPLRSGTDPNGKYWNAYGQNFINNTRQFASCAALPEIAIPVAYHSVGPGIGLEVAALKNQEQLLLDIAYAYTLRYDYRKAPENAADLYAGDCQGTLEELLTDYHQKLAAYETGSQEPSVPTDVQATQPLPSGEEPGTPPELAVILWSAGAVGAVLIGILAFCLFRSRRLKRKAGKYMKPRQSKVK